MSVGTVPNHELNHSWRSTSINIRNMSYLDSVLIETSNCSQFNAVKSMHKAFSEFHYMWKRTVTADYWLKQNAIKLRTKTLAWLCLFQFLPLKRIFVIPH